MMTTEQRILAIEAAAVSAELLTHPDLAVAVSLLQEELDKYFDANPIEPFGAFLEAQKKAVKALETDIYVFGAE